MKGLKGAYALVFYGNQSHGLFKALLRWLSHAKLVFDISDALH